MAKHVYLVVKCKTPDCDGPVIRVKHLGAEDEPDIAVDLADETEIITTSVPYGCSTCGTDHSYTREDIFVDVLEGRPQPGREKAWQA